MSGQRNINTINNLLAIGMTDGSIIVWDCELHTDKFLFQKNSRFEITYLVIDENYLLSGSMEGYIYIYDLINGTEIFSCAHNPYETTPIITSLAFFPFMHEKSYFSINWYRFFLNHSEKDYTFLRFIFSIRQ